MCWHPEQTCSAKRRSVGVCARWPSAPSSSGLPAVAKLAVLLSVKRAITCHNVPESSLESSVMSAESDACWPSEAPVLRGVLGPTFRGPLLKDALDAAEHLLLEASC